MSLSVGAGARMRTAIGFLICLLGGAQVAVAEPASQHPADGLPGILLAGPVAPEGAGDADARAASFRFALNQDPVETPLAKGEGPAADHVSVGGALHAVKWEATGLTAYMTAINAGKLINKSGDFSFSREGWFSKSANTVGIDKLTHAFNTYLITEMLQDRMERKIGNQPNARIAAAALAGGLMFLAEISDGFEKTGGFSAEDITMNLAGAGFSVLRRSVPGLRDKLDYRMMIVPNSDVYTFKGRRHFRQLRYLFSLQLAGFEGVKDTPLRFVELHAGYFATGFTAQEEARGDPVKRHLFLGVGLNMGQLLFGRHPQNRAEKIGQGALRYVQLPYTAAHGDF